MPYSSVTDALNGLKELVLGDDRGEPTQSKQAKRINVVGAGIFGISIAVALRKRGHNVTVFDRNDYSKDKYQNFELQVASVDQNKIFRASYGKKVHYQRLAMEARAKWLEMGHDLFVESGMLRVQPTSELGALELETLENMTKEGHRHQMFVRGDDADTRRAEAEGWGAKLLDFEDPQSETKEIFAAVLDTTAGFIKCSEACLYYYNLAKALGVDFVFGPEAGAFGRLVKDEAGKAVALKTKDGKEHPADVTVIAAGSFTTQCLPELSYHLESSAGSVIRYKIDPSDAKLWNKYSAANWPVLTWKSVSRSAQGKDQGSVYVFPRTEDGIIKIGYRSCKYTNFERAPENATYTQNGEWSVPAPPSVKPPQEAIDGVKHFVSIFMPEFVGKPFYSTKFCWYTDSLDNDFVIDHVPTYASKSVFVSTGGSGHGAKFLPVLGEHAADILENGDASTSPLRKFWKWRADALRVNGLQEGPKGPRNLKPHVVSVGAVAASAHS